MSSTKTNSKNSSTDGVEIKPVQESYVKNVASGFIYHVLSVPKTDKEVYLRTKNSYTKYNLLSLKQGLVKGSFCEPNEHEIRHFKERDKVYFQELTYKLLKRIMYTQLLLELDDELKMDFSDDKYVRSILEQSEKQFLRLVKETYPRMYAIDKNMLFTFLTAIQDFITKIAKVQPHEFMFMNIAIDKYFENPLLFIPENVEITKVDE